MGMIALRPKGAESLGVLYRVSDFRESNGCDEYGDSTGSHPALRVEEHEIARVTPKGWRLVNGRFVLREAHRRFACPTLAEAWESWRQRKRRQRLILQAKLDHIAGCERIAAHAATLPEDQQLGRRHTRQAWGLPQP